MKEKDKAASHKLLCHVSNVGKYCFLLIYSAQPLPFLLHVPNAFEKMITFGRRQVA
jgi:hypothetical protein